MSETGCDTMLITIGAAARLAAKRWIGEHAGLHGATSLWFQTRRARVAFYERERSYHSIVLERLLVSVV